MKYNLIIGVLFLILSILISIKLSNKFTLRRKFYQELNEFNKKLEVEINYTKRSLNEICYNSNSIISNLIKSNLLKENEKFDAKFYSFITNKELDEIIEYLNSIGIFDKNTQASVLKSKQLLLEEKLTKSKQLEEKYKPLYVKLGILIGIIILIIFL